MATRAWERRVTTTPRKRAATQPQSNAYRIAAQLWREYQRVLISAPRARAQFAPLAAQARTELTYVDGQAHDPAGYRYVCRWWKAVIDDDRHAQRRELAHQRRQSELDRPAAALQTRPARAPLAAEYVQRWQANALSQALWATQQGERSWLNLGRTVQTSVAAAVGEDVARSTAPPSGDAHTTGSVGGVSEYLDVRVPACREIGYSGEVLRLLRADLTELEQEWGVDRVRRIYHLRRRMGFEPGQSQSLDELALLALGHAGRPDLAVSWYAYLHSPRLGNVFVLHAGRGERASVQREKGRERSLGEAALALVSLVRAVGTDREH